MPALQTRPNSEIKRAALHTISFAAGLLSRAVLRASAPSFSVGISPYFLRRLRGLAGFRLQRSNLRGSLGSLTRNPPPFLRGKIRSSFLAANSPETSLQPPSFAVPRPFNGRIASPIVGGIAAATALSSQAQPMRPEESELPE